MKIDLSSASNEKTCWWRALAALQICLMMDLEEDKNQLMCSRETSPLEVRQVQVMNRYIYCLEGCMGKEEHVNDERRSGKT